MKRRGFFATLLAPLVAKALPPAPSKRVGVEYGGRTKPEIPAVGDLMFAPGAAYVYDGERWVQVKITVAPQREFANSRDAIGESL